MPLKALFINLMGMLKKIMSRDKVQNLLREKTDDIMKWANSEDVTKRELVKLLIELWVVERFVRYVLLTLLAVSVVLNILLFIK